MNFSDCLDDLYDRLMALIDIYSNDEEIISDEFTAEMETTLNRILVKLEPAVVAFDKPDKYFCSEAELFEQKRKYNTIMRILRELCNPHD